MDKESGDELIVFKGPYLSLRLQQGNKVQYPLFEVIFGDLKKGLCIHS